MEGGRPCQPRYGRGLFYREAFLDSGGGSSAPSVRHTNYFAAAGVCAKFTIPGSLPFEIY